MSHLHHTKVHLDATSIWARITGSEDALDSIQCSLEVEVAQGICGSDGAGGARGVRGVQPWVRSPGAIKVLAGLLPQVWPEFDWPQVLDDEGVRRLPEACAALTGWGW